jgi:hypothetical protein
VLVKSDLAIMSWVGLPALFSAALKFTDSHGDAPWIVEGASYL